jgi:DNA-binding transcriptional LysR family regulator
MQSSAVIAACQAVGFNPNVGHVVPDNISRLNLVAAGFGVAIVPVSLQRMNVEGVVYRRLRGAPELKIPFSVASRRGDTSAVVRQFLQLAKRTAIP